jgi:hypothetical protein
MGVLIVIGVRRGSLRRARRDRRRRNGQIVMEMPERQAELQRQRE